MNTSRTRLMAISGATLALAVASTAVVSAHPGDRGDQRGFGRDGGMERLGDGFPGLRGGLPGLRGRLAGLRSDVVRIETTRQTDDGIVTQRVDNGTATSIDDTRIDYTLATGETVSVRIDDETHVIAFSEQTVERGLRSRTRLLPTEVEVTDIAAGSEVGVWAESQADGSYLAQRIVVQPTQDETTSDEAADGAADATTDADAAPADAASLPLSDA